MNASKWFSVFYRLERLILMWPTSRLLRRSKSALLVAFSQKLSVLGCIVIVFTGCDQIGGDRVSLDEIVLPSIQKVNSFRPERVESVETEYVFFGRLTQTPQQKPLLAVSLPSELADELPDKQKVVAINRDSRTTCTLAGIAKEENPPGNRSARFSITPKVVEAGWEVGESIETRMTISRDRQGYWIPISALSQNAVCEWTLFAVVSDDANEASSDSFRIGVEQVELVHYDEDWVLVECANALELVVADGTHRIVTGQSVEHRDRTERLIRGKVE